VGDFDAILVGIEESSVRYHSDKIVRPKGWAVRPLKRYVSWVQNVARQFGPYPAWALEY